MDAVDLAASKDFPVFFQVMIIVVEKDFFKLYQGMIFVELFEQGQDLFPDFGGFCFFDAGISFGKETAEAYGVNLADGLVTGIADDLERAEVFFSMEA